MVDFRINCTLCTGEVRMHIAFGRVRHKTSPTRGGENVCLFFWFTIVVSDHGSIHSKNSLI